MARTPQQQAHALITYFETQYKDRFKKAPRVNRHADKWGFTDVLQDLPESRLRDLIDFYLTTTSSNGHSLKWFFYNYDKLNEALEEKERDAELRRKLRQQSKQRVKEYTEKYGNSRREVD